MERPRPSTVAWISAPLLVYAYDKFAPAGEMMSERADEWNENRLKRFLLGAGMGILTCHLLNLFPEGKDPLAYLIPPKETS